MSDKPDVFELAREETKRRFSHYNKIMAPVTAQPDCRTCANLDSCKEDAKWMRNYCTNGDKYQPAPAVVLWRTE